MNKVFLTTLAVAVALQSPESALSQGGEFEPTHIRRTATARFDAAPAEVFAVLAPNGQQSLTQTWDIEILSPASGEVEPGATFTKTHKRAGVQQIWTVVAVDAPEKLTYAIFVAGLETWVFAMELKSVSDGITSVDVTHTITSLSSDANADVQQFADTFDTYFASWSASIRRALEGRE